MNKTELMVLGLAAAAVYMIYLSQKPRTNNPTDTGKPANYWPAANSSVAPIDNWKWTGRSYGGSSDTGGAFGLGGF